MNVDQANTRLATAVGTEQRREAYKALAIAAFQAANNINPDESEGYALITRLIECRNILTMAAQHIEENTRGQDHGILRYQHPAIDDLEAAMQHITLAIEYL